MNQRMIRSSTVLFLCGVVTLALPGEAAEPKNNTLPYVFSGGRLEMQSLLAPPPNSSTITFVGADAISPAGDQDFIFVSCQGNTIKEIAVLDFYDRPNSPATPDIDIWVYDLGGNFVGGSASVTNLESVDVSALGHVSMYLKVFGYNQSTTSSYSVAISC